MKQYFFLMGIFCLLFNATYCEEKQPSFVLITMLYNEQSDSRIAEYEECLNKNLAHPCIKKIHVFYDTVKDSLDKPSKITEILKKKDVEVTFIKGRPSYKDVFSFANQMYPHDYIIVANADIFFNDTLNKLIFYKGSWDNIFFALTRWNVQDDNKTLCLEGFGPYAPNPMSADCWIFKSPLNPPSDSATIYLGSEGCDNKLAHVMQDAGYRVKNPCLSLQACHLHQSQIRHYLEDRAFSNHEITGIPVQWECLYGFEEDIENYTNQAHLLKSYMHTNQMQARRFYSPSYVLITMLYNEKDPIRIKEYQNALKANMQNVRIHTIHVLYDTSNDYADQNQNKILSFIKEQGFSISYIKNRISFGEAFSITNHLYPDSYVIFASADIFFDKSIEKLDSFKRWDRACFALTRWNLQSDTNYFLEGIPGGFPNFESQDAWFFKTPIFVSEKMKYIPMGVIGSSSGIAHTLMQAGYDVSNPCGSIRSYHLHEFPKIVHDPQNVYHGEKVFLPWTFLDTHPEDAIQLDYELKRIQMYDSFKIPKKEKGVTLICFVSQEQNLYKRIDIQFSLLKNKINPAIKNIIVLYTKEEGIKAESDALLEFFKREKIPVIKRKNNESLKENIFHCLDRDDIEDWVLVAQGKNTFETLFLDTLLPLKNQFLRLNNNNESGVLFYKESLKQNDDLVSEIAGIVL